MKRILFVVTIMAFGIAAQADYTVQTYQPLYPAQAVDYSGVQSYNQQYNQSSYQDPYQVQSQQQCINPYQYQRPYYGYGNRLPYNLLNSGFGFGNTNGTQSVVKNLGQSVLYSMMRGY